MDAEGPDEGIDLDPRTILYAFELVAPYATGKSNKARLEHRMELALSLIDWALMECDRGLKLLELTAQMELKPRGPDITFLGPYSG